MDVTISHTFVFVSDQDRALAFYTDILGFQLKSQVPLGPDKQWISVVPPKQIDIEIVLLKPFEGTVFNAEQAALISKIVDQGILGWLILRTEDLDQLYEDLLAKDVEFILPPHQTPTGYAATFLDDSGNKLTLMEA